MYCERLKRPFMIANRTFFAREVIDYANFDNGLADDKPPLVFWLDTNGGRINSVFLAMLFRGSLR